MLQRIKDSFSRNSNCGRARVLGYKRLDGRVLLVVTKWEILGFMESEVVRWSQCRLLSNKEMVDIMEERDLILKAM